MMKMNKNKKGQAGFVITVELLLIVTVLVIGLIAGWAKVRDQAVAELNDTSEAIGAIDQGYIVNGTRWFATTLVAGTVGFQFDDSADVSTGGAAGGRVGGDGQVLQYSTPATAATELVTGEVNAY